MDDLTMLKHDNMRFGDLMSGVLNGKIRIPDFQREFVWDLSQIINLLDSIYRHYPIGSFLFWETEDEIQSYRHVGEVELQHGNLRGVQYVLDGQQRLTSLFASLEQAKIVHRVRGKKITKNIEIYFDLDEKQFVDNPFVKSDEEKFYKRRTFVILKSQDNFGTATKSLLQFVSESKPSPEDCLQWLEHWPDMPLTRRKRIYSQFREVGLISESDNGCTLGTQGIKLVESKDPSKSLLRIMFQRVEYLDVLLPKILTDKQAQLMPMTKFISQEVGEKVRHVNIRQRFRWLAGLGFGDYDETNFTLNDIGASAIKSLLEENQMRLEEEKVREEQKKKRFFSVHQITNKTKLLRLARELDEDKFEELIKVNTRFDSYPFSVIQVMEQPIEIACEIFERINNSGKDLNVVDLMVAKSWTQSFNLRERLNEFSAELRKEHYEGIPDITVIQCLSAIVQQSIKRKDILGIAREEVEENWEKTLECTRKAIDFMKSNLRITHAKILPYNTCLVPLSFYFSVADMKKHDNARRKQLEKWFWRAVASNRYDQAVETSVGEDIEEMMLLARGETANFNYVAPAISAERIAAQRLNLGSAFCKTILCVLNQRGPREFKDSTPISLVSFSKFNSAELHHIFPKDYLSREDKENYPERDSIANIALARASANKEYSSKPPSVYLAKCGNEILEQVLSSHLIDDVEASGVFEDDFTSFIDYRSEQIQQELRRLTGEMSEVEALVSDNELAAIEQFELRLRKVIHDGVQTSNASYWEQLQPIEFRNDLEGRIERWVKETPGLTREDAREVDHLQLFDYVKVIKGNWEYFEDIFRSRKDLEAHIRAISPFRNALAHNREIDEVTRQVAIGALAWFDKALSYAERKTP